MSLESARGNLGKRNGQRRVRDGLALAEARPANFQPSRVD